MQGERAPSFEISRAGSLSKTLQQAAWSTGLGYPSPEAGGCKLDIPKHIAFVFPAKRKDGVISLLLSLE